MNDVKEALKVSNLPERGMQPEQVADFEYELGGDMTDATEVAGKHITEAPRERLVRDRLQAVNAAVAPVTKDVVLQQVEDILSENLADEFKQLAEDRRQAFKNAGEEAANSIYALVTVGKATLKNVLKLIERWLAMIVTKQGYWWVKQEAYIKAKKILLLNSLA